jgi:hypothetical protein
MTWTHEDAEHYAKFQGLCTCLHAAIRHQLHPLTVIGDSVMILSLTQARRAAAAIRVIGWHHHYRAQNIMADKAANIAMDARRSVQALAQDAREELTALNPFLTNDCETLGGATSPFAPKPRQGGGSGRLIFLARA